MASALQLDREALTQRVREQSADLMTQTACILQGGVLSAAGFALIEILRHPTDGLIRVMLWVVSLVVCFIIFFRLAIRAPFYVRNSADVFLVLPVLGVCEIVLFACLTLSEPGSWRMWFLGGVFLSLVGLPANAVLGRSVQARHYAVEIEPVFIFLRAKPGLSSPRPWRCCCSPPPSARGFGCSRRIGPTRQRSSPPTWRFPS